MGYGINRTVTLYIEAVGANVQMAALADTYALVVDGVALGHHQRDADS